ncbi:MAG: hypothetical protein GKR90_20605 [Pseudomonadales bacterium]|nr:hypothetical protein [Pseudomonadales bacterium]
MTNGCNTNKVLILSTTARGSRTATGQLIDSIFSSIDNVQTLSLHAGHKGGSNHLESSFTVRAPRKVCREIRGFDPSLIYVRPTSSHLGYNLVSWLLLCWCRIPFVVHLMDDEERDVSTTGFAERRIFGLYLRWLLKRAADVFTVSPGMSRAFESRYGRPSVVLANYPLTFTSKAEFRNEMRIGYFGSLDARMNRDSVRRLSLVISSLAQQGSAVSLDIYTREQYSDWAQAHCASKVVRVLPQVPSNAYRDTLAEYAVLLVAYNFDQLSIAYCRYSIANKLADYLATSAKIVVVGPTEIETVKLCRDHNLATVLDDETQNDLESILEKETRVNVSVRCAEYVKAMELEEGMERWKAIFQ